MPTASSRPAWTRSGSPPTEAGDRGGRWARRERAAGADPSVRCFLVRAETSRYDARRTATQEESARSGPAGSRRRQGCDRPRGSDPPRGGAHAHTFDRVGVARRPGHHPRRLYGRESDDGAHQRADYRPDHGAHGRPERGAVRRAVRGTQRGAVRGTQRGAVRGAQRGAVRVTRRPAAAHRRRDRRRTAR